MKMRDTPLPPRETPTLSAQLRHLRLPEIGNCKNKLPGPIFVERVHPYKDYVELEGVFIALEMKGHERGLLGAR